MKKALFTNQQNLTVKDNEISPKVDVKLNRKGIRLT